MKLRIKSENKNIRLYLPNSFLKSKFILKKLLKEKYNDSLHITIKDCYKTLKQYVKQNGHFELVNIVTSDGDIVYIYF